MAEVYSRYSAKALEPVSAQFNDPIDKQSAVKAYNTKCGKVRNILLFPSVSEQDILQQDAATAVETETVTGSRTTRKCSKCKRPGHTKRNCPM